MDKFQIMLSEISQSQKQMLLWSVSFAQLRREEGTAVIPRGQVGGMQEVAV